MSKIKIVEKLRKLMIHERSARSAGNIGEADNFRRMIAHLREINGIAEDIVIDLGDTPDPGVELVFQPSSAAFRPERIVWQEIIFGAVCGFFGAGSLVHVETNLKQVVADPPTRAAVIESYRFLVRQAAREARRFRRHAGASDLTSFFTGFALTIEHRLKICKSAETEVARVAEIHDVRPERFVNASTAIEKVKRIRAVRSQADAVTASPSTTPAAEHDAPAAEPLSVEIDENVMQAGMFRGGQCELGDAIDAAYSRMVDDLEDVQRQVMKKRSPFTRAYTMTSTSSW